MMLHLNLGYSRLLSVASAVLKTHIICALKGIQPIALIFPACCKWEFKVFIELALPL